MRLPPLLLRRAVVLWLFVGAAVVALWPVASQAQAAPPPPPPPPPFFDYLDRAPHPRVAPSPVLRDDNASDVRPRLGDLRAGGAPLAVKVPAALARPAAVQLFNDFSLEYVFTDFAGAARVGRARAVADQVLASAASRDAFVGNFNLYPNAGNDSTRPASLPASAPPRFAPRPANVNFADARGRVTAGGTTRLGRQVAVPALFPGSVDFRNPADGNSNAPNIRSALFTLPVQRMTFAALGARGLNGTPAGAGAFAVNGAPPAAVRVVPAVQRFNALGNAALDLDATRPGVQFAQRAADPVNGQLLSRGDFSAMVLHLRMRGADGLILNHGSVEGYTDAQEIQDAAGGWQGSAVADAIFGRHNYNFASMANTIGDAGGNSGDASPRSTEVAGAVWSGVYDRSGSGRRMAILLSNLSQTQKAIDLPNSIGGFMTFTSAADPGVDASGDFLIGPGQHRLLEFSLRSINGRLRWDFNGGSFIGTDNNRNGTGLAADFDLTAPTVPEPSGLVAAAAGLGTAVLLLARRRRLCRAAVRRGPH